MTDPTLMLREEPTDGRYLGSGDEAGTSPGDRRFRPDVEGLRAVAVLLVVLYHAEFPGITGGFVGVDVFFVISGFVITGLLLRERASTDSTSLLSFYARRCRRILPAATLVILSAVTFSYVFLGMVTGANTAGDGRWAAVFLANFHFEEIGTDYFLALRPPSPLQNFWSLSVEEQFYIVYPSLFLLMARMKGRLSLRVRLALALVPVIALSYMLSIVQTSHSPSAAYFSPFTRAWELGLGALIAVGVPVLTGLPERLCAVLTWSGFAAIIVAAFTFSSTTPYPGSLVAIPVVGTGLVIAGGVGMPRWGAEALLGLRPALWLGRLSYSLYLWHWPILVIAAQQAGKSQLPVWENAILVLAAIGLSMLTYRLVENPIRHSKLVSGQSLVLGGILVGSTLLLLSLALTFQPAGAAIHRIVPAPNASVEHEVVVASASIKRLPARVQPPVGSAASDWGGDAERSSCIATLPETSEAVCHLGDPRGTKLMVVYGDSHAAMWLPAFEWIATSAHWRLVVLSKPYCPAVPITIANPPELGTANSPDVDCDEWHTWATKWINSHRPQLLVVTQESIYKVPVQGASSPRWAYISDWHKGLESLFASFTDKQTRTVILGNIPALPQPGPQCLAAHANDVQACSAPTASSIEFSNSVEQSSARHLGIGYINTIPWFCSKVCTALVGHFNVYLDGVHITASWATYLEVVLGQALGLVPGSRASPA